MKRYYFTGLVIVALTIYLGVKIALILINV